MLKTNVGATHFDIQQINIVEYVAGSGENRFRWNFICSSFTQEEPNLLRHFDRSLHDSNTQLQLHQYIFSWVKQCTKSTGELLPTRDLDCKMLKGFYVPYASSIPLLPNSWSEVWSLSNSECFIRPEMELNQYI